MNINQNVISNSEDQDTNSISMDAGQDQVINDSASYCLAVVAQVHQCYISLEVLTPTLFVQRVGYQENGCRFKWSLQQ